MTPTSRKCSAASSFEEKKGLKRLNLGCGRRYREGWTNADLQPAGDDVIRCDVRAAPLPFQGEQFDVVYHSHVLEHLEPAQAKTFVQECRRILKGGGVLRVAVPDLEGIVRDYLRAMERVLAGEEEARADHQWMILELYDQTVRSRSGGRMAEYLVSSPPNADFVIRRLGEEARAIMASRPVPGAHRDLLPMIRRRLRKALSPKYWKDWLLRCLLGKEFEALQLGRFRLAGEIHQWMYDRVSLAQLLRQCGFAEVVQQTAETSYLSGWADCHLDTEPDGRIYKPDSLYMEARKPL